MSYSSRTWSAILVPTAAVLACANEPPAPRPPPASCYQLTFPVDATLGETHMPSLQLCTRDDWTLESCARKARRQSSINASMGVAPYRESDIKAACGESVGRERGEGEESG